MVRRFDLIVFDWDGTLMDSTAAIACAIQSSAQDMGLPIPSDNAARQVIGLGLRDALALRCLNCRWNNTLKCRRDTNITTW